MSSPQGGDGIRRPSEPPARERVHTRAAITLDRSPPPRTEADARAAAHGIHRISLPTPFAVGRVNAYLIETEPLTLVDCGPNTATGLNQLETRLRELGHSVEELGLLVLTHQHVDHCGLAGPLAERVDLEVACLDVMAGVLEDWTAHTAEADGDAHRLMRRHGVAPAIADALRSVSRIVSGYGASSPVDRRLADGDVLELGDRRFHVAHRPGHSPTDTVLFDPASRIAIVGDHVLRRISSNALVERVPGGPADRRPEPLLAYRHSLAATAATGIEIALAGHGSPVVDPAGLIAERLESQARRAERFGAMLADGPASAHELAVRRWGDVAITEAFLTLSEVLGHLGLLLADGRVLEDRSETVIRFHAA